MVRGYVIYLLMDNKIAQTLGAENNRLLISHSFFGWGIQVWHS